MKTLLSTSILWSMTVLLFTTCNSQLPADSRPLTVRPAIFPDYIGATIPVNIAPLNFRPAEGGECKALFTGKNTRFVVSGKTHIEIPAGKWQRLLHECAGDTIAVTLYARQDGQWNKYRPFPLYVSPDSIDSYLTYRLIEPTYANWNEMGIYQRHLSSFREEEIIANDRTGHNCMNCHSFNRHNPSQMVMHMRKINPGTLLMKDGKAVKLDTRTDYTISGFVYPYWHPGGNDIAFSNNNTQMSFYEAHDKVIEVYDLHSDIVLYHIPTNEVYTSPLLSAPDRLENFPVFAPDGKTLYFCTCLRVDSLPQNHEQVKYKLCSIGFDAATQQFATQVDTLIDLTPQGKGISLPSASPDGRFLVCSVAESGCFLSWDKTSDLYLYHTGRKELMPLTPLNTTESESYTSWSSNSRWLIFSSRRLDGVFNRPFIAHVSPDGRVGKPFLLPQRHPDYYQFLHKAYNLPQLLKAPVPFTPREIGRLATTTATLPVTFRPTSASRKVKQHDEGKGEVN